MDYNYVKKHDIFASLHEDDPINIVDGKGALLINESGKEYIDLSQLTQYLGQRNETFDRKIKIAFDEITVSKSNFSHYKNKLIKLMIETTNHNFDKILFTTSGSEAVEWGLKLAKKRTGRCETLSFWDSIHGRTQYSASSSGMPNRKIGYGPMLTRCYIRCLPKL